MAEERFSLNVNSIERDQTVLVTRADPANTQLTPAATAKLFLTGESGETKEIPQNGSSLVSLSGQSATFQFRISRDLPLGSYIGKIQILPKGLQTSTNLPLASQVAVPNSPSNKLTIISEIGMLTPSITAVVPRIIYPQPNGKYSFTVVGSDFSPTGPDNHLMISTRIKDDNYSPVPEVDVCWKDADQCQKSSPESAIGKVSRGNRQLQFTNIMLDTNTIHGELGVQVRVGNVISKPEVPIILSRVQEREPHWWVAGVSAVIIAALVYLLNFRPFKTTQPRDGSFRSTLGSLLVDPETNTYSLSRLQFLLWSSVAVISYAFLFLSRVLAQDKPEFLNIPSGLPGIVLISSATAILGSGVTSIKGSKGSAQLGPQLSDFYSAGGYALPERLQFLVWTIVGVIAFLYLVFSQGSGEIDSLPTIPQGFLQLSGMSSFAYLGGKIARTNGPVITGMDAAEYDGKNLTLVIKGGNLSRNASFKIQKQSTSPALTEFIDVPKDVTAMSKVVDPIDASAGNVLEVSIPSCSNEWPISTSPDQKNKYRFILFNPDLQFAEWEFDGVTQSHDPPLA